MAWEQCQRCPYNGKYKCAPPQNPNEPCPQRDSIAHQEELDRPLVIEILRGQDPIWLAPDLMATTPLVISVTSALDGRLVDYWFETSDNGVLPMKDLPNLMFENARARAKQKWNPGHWRILAREVMSGSPVAQVRVTRKE